MKKYIIIAFSLILFFLVAFYLIRKPVISLDSNVEIQTKDTCYLDGFFLPEPDYKRYNDNDLTIHFNYLDMDLRKETSRLISFHYPSDSLPIIDSINPIFKKLIEDSKNETKNVGMQIKFKELYFYDFCKILCQNKQLLNVWFPDFRYNELILFCSYDNNKISGKAQFLKKYKEDIEGLKRVEDMKPYRYFFSYTRDGETRDSLLAFRSDYQRVMFDFRKQFATLEHYEWKDNNLPLERMQQLMTKLNSKYESQNSKDESYNQFHRLGINIQIGESISLENVLKVITLAQKNNLLYYLNNHENSLILYTTCSTDDDLYEYY